MLVEIVYDVSHRAPQSWATRAAVVAMVMVGGVSCGSDSAVSSGAASSTTTSTNTVSTTSAGPYATDDKLAVKGLTALPLSGCVSSDFYGPVTVGNTEFQLLIDSGSSSTAVAAQSCTECSALSPLYDTSHGTTQSQAVTTQYGDNSSWSGLIYTDTVAALSGNVALTSPVDVSFAAITQATSFFTTSMCPGNNDANNSYQGILGLGPDTLLEPHTTSWMDALKSNKPLSNDAFAVQICDMGGRMWFGGYDPNYISGEPLYTPMVQTGTAGEYYGVKVADMQLGGTSLGLSSSVLGTTVVDTGTSAFIVPTTVFEKIATSLLANANFKANFPADNKSDSIIYTGGCAVSAKDLTPAEVDAALPTMGISFPNSTGSGTISLELKATESYIYSVDVSTGGYAYCFSMTYSPSTAIFGNTMMRSHIVVFDRANEQVGFVPQAPCLSGLPTGSFTQ